MDIDIRAEFLGEVIVQAEFAGISPETGIQDGSLLVRIGQGSIVTGSLAAAGHGHVRIVRGAVAEQQGKPVRVCIFDRPEFLIFLFEGGDGPVIRTDILFVGLQVREGVLDSRLVCCDVLVAGQHLLRMRDTVTEVVVETDLRLCVPAAALGRDDDDTVGGLGSVDGRSGSVLQDGHAFDVIRIQTGQRVQASRISLSGRLDIIAPGRRVHI